MFELKITDVEPIQHELLFERFLKMSTTQMPTEATKPIEFYLVRMTQEEINWANSEQGNLNGIIQLYRSIPDIGFFRSEQEFINALEYLRSSGGTYENAKYCGLKYCGFVPNLAKPEKIAKPDTEIDSNCFLITNNREDKTILATNMKVGQLGFIQNGYCEGDLVWMGMVNNQPILFNLSNPKISWDTNKLMETFTKGLKIRLIEPGETITLTGL